MRYDVKCAVDILIELEKLDFNQKIDLQSLCNLLPQYDSKVVVYSVVKLSEAGYIKTNHSEISLRVLDSYIIFDITYNGHEYLKALRS